VPSYGSLKGDTVYVAAVDRDGNAASLIQSLYGVFGSCTVAGRTGVVMQNRSAYFSLDPAHPNRLEPGKIPLHTLIASMAKRNGKLWAVLGCMGADGQPQIQLQLYSAMIDHGLNQWGDWHELAWHAHGITIDSNEGVLSGGSDPRSDGAAIGY
jgi:gamma-glutamyltranspeptidase